MQLHVSPETWVGQWATDQGIQQIATNAVAPATKRRRGRAPTSSRGSSDRSSTRDRRPSSERSTYRSAAQSSPPRGHPDGAHARPNNDVARSLFVLRILDEDREKRHATDQETRQGTRDMSFCRCHAVPRIPNSTTPKRMIQRRFLMSTGICRRVMTSGAKSSDAGPVRSSTMTPGSSWRTATRISK